MAATRIVSSLTLGLLLMVFSISASGQAKPAAGEDKAKGVVSVCTTIDDDWKCVGESNVWEANKKFDVLFVNPVKVGVEFIGIMFYKQLPDGKDGDFLYEFQQNIGSENRKYATVNSGFYLPAGTYTIYIISWGKRESLYKNGNYSDYFAKTTLKVK